MNYIIHTYFNSDQVATVLRSVVMLVGSGGTDGDYLALIRTAAMIGLFMATCYGFVKARGDEAGQYMVMVALFYSTLFVPRVTVTVQDHGIGVGAPIPVSNVPIGLAFFASTTSQIGYWLTDRTETFFSYPDSTLQLNGHGLMGAARSLRLAQSASIKSPIVLQDTLNFMKECVNPELISQPSKIDNLVQSTKIWSDLASLALINPGRMVYLQSNQRLEDCGTAYSAVLTPAIATQASDEMSIIAKVLSPFTSPAVANAQLASMLPAAEGLMMGAGSTAVDAIKQRMLINLFQDGPSSLAALMNDPASVQIAQGAAMSSSMANNSYLQTANMAKEAMPLLRNAIELVVISIFPIMLVLIIIAGSKGGTVLRSYVMTLLWVQLWAPLYAIVNFVGTMAAARSVKAVIGASSGASIANAAAMYDGLISSEAVAGMLTISVPLLALAIVKGGEMAMTGLTSSVLGPAQSAAGSVGAQVGLGNTNMGNYSTGNVQTGNRQANSSSMGFKYSSQNAGFVEDANGTYRVAGGDGTNQPRVFALAKYTGGLQLGMKQENTSGRTLADSTYATSASNESAGYTSSFGSEFLKSDGTKSDGINSTSKVKGYTSQTTGKVDTSSDTKLGNANVSTNAANNTFANGQSITTKAGVGAGATASYNEASYDGENSAQGDTPPDTNQKDQGERKTDPDTNQKYQGKRKTEQATANVGFQLEAGLINTTANQNTYATGQENRTEAYSQTGKGSHVTKGSTVSTGGQMSNAQTVQAGEAATASTKDSAIAQRATSKDTSNGTEARKNVDQRESSGLQAQENYQDVFDKHLLALSGGDPQKALRASHATQQEAARNAYAELTGGKLSGLPTLSGNPLPEPKTQNEIAQSGKSAVNQSDPANRERVRAEAAGHRAAVKRFAAEHNAPDPGAPVDYENGANNAAAEIEGINNETKAQRFNQAVEAGITRLADASFKADSGTGRLLKASFLSFLPGLNPDSPDDFRNAARQVASNNGKFKQLLADIGDSGRVTPEHVKQLKALRQ